MKRYQITSTLSIEGETLKEAIENNFDRIAKDLHLGNVAGYQLHHVWCEYDPTKQAAVLHIIATGSDVLVNYDPAKDTPQEHTLSIRANPEDCPQRIDFELAKKSDRPFDPFDYNCLTSPSAYFGTLIALIDEIGERHCKIKMPLPVTNQVSQHSPTLSYVYPIRYIEQCRQELARRRPKTDNGTAKLMELVSQLASKILEYSNDKFESSMIWEVKAKSYFATTGKITALAKIRMDKGMTQKQLADAAQMSVRQLQNYEKCPGSTLWSASRSVPGRLAAALGVNRSAIVDDGGFPILVNK